MQANLSSMQANLSSISSDKERYQDGNVKLFIEKIFGSIFLSITQYIMARQLNVVEQWTHEH